MSFWSVNQRGRRRDSQILRAKSKSLSHIKWHEWDADQIFEALKSNNLTSSELFDLIRQKLQYVRNPKLAVVLDRVIEYRSGRRHRKPNKPRVHRQPAPVRWLVLRDLHESDLCTDSRYAHDHFGQFWHYWQVGDDYAPDPPQSHYYCEGCGAEVTHGWARKRWGPWDSGYYSFRVFCDRCTYFSRHRPRFKGE
jgi:hypothetical protein